MFVHSSHASNVPSCYASSLAAILLILPFLAMSQINPQVVENSVPFGYETSLVRSRILINDGWRFMRYASDPDSLIYDIRPEVSRHNDNIAADTKPTESVDVVSSQRTLKAWILPTANPFINNPADRHSRPPGSPGKDFPFVQADFNDDSWTPVELPHDWAIAGPFYEGDTPIIGGGMGRLPVHGVAWYRRKLDITPADEGRVIYLDIDGAMSYAMVWLNGHLVGGWPYGYNSFRLDLTPYLNPGGDNQLAIRLDNPPHSARWYPGGGLYRNVWLTKTTPVHVSQWGTFVHTREISESSATLDLEIQIENKSPSSQQVEVETSVFELDANNKRGAQAVVVFPRTAHTIGIDEPLRHLHTAEIKNPKLWGPLPQQKPNRYVAVTRLYLPDSTLADEYETRFGIRSVVFDAQRGLFVNGQAIRIQGVNQHHDLGAIGAAFNVRAAERQLELLQELGCNAIRMAHNPPAPELLELADRMGFLVIDEIFDSWERKKTPLDFHLIFPEWHEADTRAFIRRDRNHPSIIAWSFGNEVGEQYTEAAGAALAKRLHDIVKEEDPTRPSTASMNYAKPDMPFAAVSDIINLNYQGEGIRDAPAYAHLQGIKTSPLYPAFHERFPDKMIISSETASALSSRGSYLFPVFEGNSAPVSEGIGGNRKTQQVSAYELYTAAFGSSADKVFASQDRHPYVAGEFVWTGWDYLGEPTPYYTARSSYSGIIDLAGFKKDRFYLYQSRWRPELRMAHILPHWTWPERLGEITPVHVFSAADEAELFLNGESLGRKKKGEFEYRFRWDDVKYAPGELRVFTYKNGELWASDTVITAGSPAQLELQVDRQVINADGKDLAFITVRILDDKGNLVPHAGNEILFELNGPGEIVATDNGNPADLRAFPSLRRAAFNGMALAIVRSEAGNPGELSITAKATGIPEAQCSVTTAATPLQ